MLRRLEAGEERRIRRINLGSAVFLVVAATWTGRRSCSPDYALDLAGYFSSNCGIGRPREDREPVIQCLLKAQAEGRAARATFYRDGIDSTVIEVFLRDGDGASLLLNYDGDIFGGGGDGFPRLRQKKCARFEQVTREWGLDVGPDLDCIEPRALPDLCP